VLRFTVFWMSIKRRRWAFFYAIFDEMEEFIGLEHWLRAAEAVSGEECVSLSHIRLAAEHRRIVNTASWSVVDDKSSSSEMASVFADESRQRLHSSERCMRVRRQLQAGDFVWGLYNKGSVWLPAKVSVINKDGTYNLSYLASSDDVREAQLATSNRQFLPRRADKKKERLAVKPFASEQAVCAYVFDLIQDNASSAAINAGDGTPVKTHTGSAGKRLPSSYIAAQLKTKRFEDVVRTSAALSAVTSSEYCLLEVLSEAFAESDDKCDQGEFVEFCTEALELVTFSSSTAGAQ
jgi:hypothetical protein